MARGETPAKLSRKAEILQALAKLLEAPDCARITTAGLAREVGFSEAALYRHFASKTQMYEALLEFSEEVIFSAINGIDGAVGDSRGFCEQCLGIVFTFAQRNRGITKLVCGYVLEGEDPRLQRRATQIMSRLESTIKQQIRVNDAKCGATTGMTPGQTAALLTDILEGRLHRFVRSDFKRDPAADWVAHWQLLSEHLFLHSPPPPQA